jgi:DNA-binding transcriptional ArsR family regulator
MDQSQAVAAFAALAEPTRLDILRYLIRCGPDGAPAGEIGGAVKASSSRASFHLATLSQAGLLTSRRQSRRILYQVDFQRMGSLVAYLVQDCCAGRPEVAACCQPVTSAVDKPGAAS